MSNMNCMYDFIKYEKYDYWVKTYSIIDADT